MKQKKKAVSHIKTIILLKKSQYDDEKHHHQIRTPIKTKPQKQRNFINFLFEDRLKSTRIKEENIWDKG